MTFPIDEGCKNVSDNFKKIRDFITYLISDLEYYRKDLETSFTSYLEEIKKLVTGYGNDQNNINMEKKPYDKINKMYDKLINVLQKVPQLISEDYDYLMSLGSGLCYLSKNIENLKHIIEATNDIDTIDKYQKLGRLIKQFKSALFKYNKLATDYNKEVTRINVMKSYLARGIIMYSSNITNKKYSLYIDVEVSKFVSLVEKDKASQMKSYILKTLLKRFSENMRALSTNTITPISLMSLDELPISHEQSTHIGSLY